jgi:hypothetical protein
MVHRMTAFDARTPSEALERAVICTGVNPNSYKTFRTTTGTAWYRLRTSAETVSLVVARLAHGCKPGQNLIYISIYISGELSRLVR